jgi:hypothetical protein
VTIDDERPDDELPGDRLPNVLTVALQIALDSLGKTGIGSVPCPICHGGRVGYSIAARGSVAARCSTPGCVAFIS